MEKIGLLGLKVENGQYLWILLSNGFVLKHLKIMLCSLKNSSNLVDFNSEKLLKKLCFSFLIEHVELLFGQVEGIQPSFYIIFERV